MKDYTHLFSLSRLPTAVAWENCKLIEPCAVGVSGASREMGSGKNIVHAAQAKIAMQVGR